ncbi:MAG: hypothetical protein CMC86_07635 [Flavobacteriaceae bacterium]|nr:hypothetical protein [Flavobacteriaceae bacterium]
MISIGTLGFSGLYKEVSTKSFYKILKKIVNSKKKVELHSSSAYEILNKDLNKIIARFIQETEIPVHLKLFSQPEEFETNKLIVEEIESYKELFGDNLKSIFIHKPLKKKRKIPFIVKEIKKLNIKAGVCLEQPINDLIENKNIDYFEIPLNLLDLKNNLDIVFLCKENNKKVFARSLLASGLLSGQNIYKKEYFDIFRKRFEESPNLKLRQSKAKSINNFYKSLNSPKNKSFEWFCYDMIKIFINPDYLIFGGSNLNQINMNLDYDFFNEYNLEDNLDSLILDWSAPYF